MNKDRIKGSVPLQFFTHRRSSEKPGNDESPGSSAVIAVLSAASEATSPMATGTLLLWFSSLIKELSTAPCV